MLQLNQFFIQLQNAQTAYKHTLVLPFSTHIWECARALQSIGVFHDVQWVSKKHGFTTRHSSLQRPYGLKGPSASLEPTITKKENTPNSTWKWHTIHCTLRYDTFGPLVQKIELCTTPGRQYSWSYTQIMHESGKPGHLLFLTEYGIVTEAEALRGKIGGIPLCRIFLHPWC